jgi:hypothetical protein
MYDVSSVVEIILRITRDKGLQKKTHPPLHLIHNSHSNQTLYTQPGVTFAQIIKQNSYASTDLEQEPRINQSHQQTSDIQELKYIMTSLYKQMGTMLNLLTTVLNKLK